MATVQNIVSTANLGCPLNLNELSAAIPTSEYNRKKFNGLILRLTDPKATVLLFSSGKFVCIGTKTLRDNELAMHKLASIINAKGCNCTITDIQIENIVGSGSINSRIDLNFFAKVYRKSSIYEPELFSGMKFNFPDTKGTAIIFTTGKIIVTGFKTIEHMNRFFNKVRFIAQGFEVQLKK